MKDTDYLTESLLKRGLVSVGEQEIVRFGLESLKGTLTGFILAAVIGFVFGNAWNGICLYLIVFPLRKYAGGYHADTRLACFISSALVMAAVFFFLYLYRWDGNVYILVVVFFDTVIVLTAPMGNRNKPLDDAEKKVYRKMARRILLIENLLFIAAFIFDWKEAVSVITMGIVVPGVSLIMGLVKSCRTRA